MKTVRFDPAKDLILLWTRLWGPLGDRRCVMALDTGASDTLIRPDILDGLGYNPRDAGGVTTVTTALGVEPGYWLPVKRLWALGYEFTDFRVNAHDLPEKCGLDGLLGLNFLEHFNYEVRSKEGVILVTPV